MITDQKGAKFGVLFFSQTYYDPKKTQLRDFDSFFGQAWRSWGSSKRLPELQKDLDIALEKRLHELSLDDHLHALDGRPERWCQRMQRVEVVLQRYVEDRRIEEGALESKQKETQRRALAAERARQKAEAAAAAKQQREQARVDAEAAVAAVAAAKAAKAAAAARLEVMRREEEERRALELQQVAARAEERRRDRERQERELFTFVWPHTLLQGLGAEVSGPAAATAAAAAAAAPARHTRRGSIVTRSPHCSSASSSSSSSSTSSSTSSPPPSPSTSSAPSSPCSAEGEKGEVWQALRSCLEAEKQELAAAAAAAESVRQAVSGGSGSTLLKAVVEGQCVQVQELLRAGQRPEAVHMVAAVQHDKPKVLHQLLLAGGDVFGRVEGGNSQQRQQLEHHQNHERGRGVEVPNVRRGDRLVHVAIRLNRLACLVTILQGQLQRQPPSPPPPQKKQGQQEEEQQQQVYLLQPPLALWDHPCTMTREEAARRICSQLAAKRRQQQQLGQQQLGQQQGEAQTQAQGGAQGGMSPVQVNGAGQGQEQGQGQGQELAAEDGQDGSSRVLRVRAKDSSFEASTRPLKRTRLQTEVSSSSSSSSSVVLVDDGEQSDEPVAIWGVSRPEPPTVAKHQRGGSSPSRSPSRPSSSPLRSRPKPMASSSRGGKGMIWRGGGGKYKKGPRSSSEVAAVKAHAGRLMEWSSVTYAPQPSLEKLRLLVVGCRDRDHRTSLHLASSEGNVLALQLLLSVALHSEQRLGVYIRRDPAHHHDGDEGAAGVGQQSPLLPSNAPLLPALVPPKSVINWPDRSGNTALHWCTDLGTPADAGVACARLLLVAGCDASLPDRKGFYPLTWACINERFSLIRVLQDSAGEGGRSVEPLITPSSPTTSFTPSNLCLPLPLLARPSKQQDDITLGLEKTRVQIEAASLQLLEADPSKFPRFAYISRSVVDASAIKKAVAPVMPLVAEKGGCKCTRPCYQNPECPCRSKNQSRVLIQTQPNGGQLLPDAGDKKKLPYTTIFECHAGCSCCNQADAAAAAQGRSVVPRVPAPGEASVGGYSEDCGLRFNHHGLEVELEVAYYPRKGWGVKTLEKICQGEFVLKYAGEIVSVQEGRRREREYNQQAWEAATEQRQQQQRRAMEGRAPVENDDDDAAHGSATTYIIFVEGHCKFAIDSTRMGNVARLLNHSCQPSLVARRVNTGSRFAEVCFFAARDIPAGEEMTWCYSDKADKNGPRCHCGAAKCRGYL